MVQRYTHECDQNESFMVEDPDGNYVPYTDYKALCDAVEAWGAACEKLFIDCSQEAWMAKDAARDHMLALAKKGKP